MMEPDYAGALAKLRSEARWGAENGWPDNAYYRASFGHTRALVALIGEQTAALQLARGFLDMLLDVTDDEDRYDAVNDAIAAVAAAIAKATGAEAAAPKQGGRG